MAEPTPLRNPGTQTRAQPWDSHEEQPYDGINPLPVLLAGTPEITGTVDTALWVSEWQSPGYGATAGAHDANDALGDKVMFTRSMDGRPVPKKGRLLRVVLLDRADQTLAATVHLFTANFTAAASDAAFTISVQDGRNWLTSVTPAMTDLGSIRAGEVNDVDADYYCPQQAIWGQLSTTGTPTVGAGTMPMVQLFIMPLV